MAGTGMRMQPSFLDSGWAPGTTGRSEGSGGDGGKERERGERGITRGNEEGGQLTVTVQ